MTRLALATSLVALSLVACSAGSGDDPGTGAAGTGSGAAGTGAAGTGQSGTAGTGSAGTGAAGTGVAGTTGAAGTGRAGTTGTAGTTGSAGTGAAGTTGAAGATGAAGTGSAALTKFSFFVTSYPSMKALAGKPEGFGGDLRFGKADGLAGADEICRQVAEKGMAGAGQKKWRAFLSVTASAPGGPIDARSRIGTGPWYDAQGRLIANDLTGLFAGARPAGDAAVVNDLPNEFGQPNHYVGANGLQTTTVDNHDTLTGSDTMGRLRSTAAADTCNDWTSTTGTGRPWIGHSWPRSATNGTQWSSDHQAPGCTAGVDKTLGGSGTGNCIGCGGGFGGFFCFAVP